MVASENLKCNPATVAVCILFTLIKNKQHATKRHYPFFKKAKQKQQ